MSRNAEKSKKTMQDHLIYSRAGIIELMEINNRENVVKRRLNKIRNKKFIS